MKVCQLVHRDDGPGGGVTVVIILRIHLGGVTAIGKVII